MNQPGLKIERLYDPLPSVLSRAFLSGAAPLDLHDAPLGCLYGDTMHHLDACMETLCTTGGGFGGFVGISFF